LLANDTQPDEQEKTQRHSLPKRNHLEAPEPQNSQEYAQALDQFRNHDEDRPQATKRAAPHKYHAVLAKVKKKGPVVGQL
jgi:hypothetical protein